jgi:uncharacterized tellurite resistance protein B-like protein
MIDSIKDFFGQFVADRAAGTARGREHALQVATAALLLETMRMDDRITVEERQAIVAALGREFGLDAGELDRLVDLAEQEARQATDYYQFTALVNQSCDAAQKLRIIENMWRVAMADGHLDAHELHLMRKIADLLHVGHADYVAAKQRAREAAGLPAA